MLRATNVITDSTGIEELEEKEMMSCENSALNTVCMIYFLSTKIKGVPQLNSGFKIKVGKVLGEVISNSSQHPCSYG